MENLRLIKSNFIKITGQRDPNFNGKFSISLNINLKSLEEIDESGKNLKISYLFEVNYDKLGSILIEGQIFINSSSEDIKELINSWKEKKFENSKQIIITNLIIQKASIKAFEMEEELGLPIHIKFPSLELKTSKEN